MNYTFVIYLLEDLKPPGGISSKLISMSGKYPLKKLDANTPTIPYNIV